MVDLKRPKSRANSDVSQLGESMLGRRVASPDSLTTSAVTDVSSVADGSKRLKRSSSVGTSQSTEKDFAHLPPEETHHDTSASLPATTSPSPVLQPLNDVHEDKTTSSAPISPRLPRAASTQSVPLRRKGTKRPSPNPTHANTGSMAFKGTIARATVDTTLAVIPAEAFKKLTRKFPKASGTVVQVVLERFSRVTFMTGETIFAVRCHQAECQHTSTSDSRAKFSSRKRHSTSSFRIRCRLNSTPAGEWPL